MAIIKSRRIVVRIVLVTMITVVAILAVVGTLIFRPEIVMDTADPTMSGGSTVGGVVDSTVPSITGTDYEGRAVSITPDQHPMAIAIVAHWCQYCRAELRELRQAISSGTFQPTVPLAIISTRHMPFVSWPPEEVLNLSDFPGTVVADTNSSLANYFGVTSVPLWYFTDSQGVIREVVNGTLTPEEVNQHAAQVAQAH